MDADPRKHHLLLITERDHITLLHAHDMKDMMALARIQQERLAKLQTRLDKILLHGMLPQIGDFALDGQRPEHLHLMRLEHAVFSLAQIAAA